MRWRSDHIRRVTLGGVLGLVAACSSPLLPDSGTTPFGADPKPATAPTMTETARSCAISYVVDGDTVTLTCPGKHRQRARLMGFDSPEIFSPRCSAEKALGLRASREMRQLVASDATKSFSFHGHDRYGRALVRMRIDGTDVAQIMIAQGLAVPYFGHRRINWCTRLGQI